MRIGVLGLGRIGAFHAETPAGFDGVDLVVNDARPEVTEAVGAKLGVATAASPAALLAAGVDGVVTAADSVEASWIAEAATRSRHLHRPVTLSEVRP